MEIIKGSSPEPLRPATKSITYAAGTTGLAGAQTTIFTITGEVLIVYLVPFCTTLLEESAGTPTLSLGVANSVALFVAATNAVEIDANEFWVDTAPDPYGIALPAALKEIVITDNIVCKVAGTNNISAGVIRFDVYWRPLSSDGSIAAA